MVVMNLMVVVNLMVVMNLVVCSLPVFFGAPSLMSKPHKALQSLLAKTCGQPCVNSRVTHRVVKPSGYLRQVKRPSLRSYFDLISQSPGEIKRRELSWSLTKKLDASAGPGEIKRREVVLDPQVSLSRVFTLLSPSSSPSLRGR